MHAELTRFGKQSNKTKNRNKRGEKGGREREVANQTTGFHNDKRDDHDDHRPGVHRRASLPTIHCCLESPCQMSYTFAREV
ncbi:hypothetical protein CsSME_00037045 [Camellia sinensis var. sinensis]